MGLLFYRNWSLFESSLVNICHRNEIKWKNKKYAKSRVLFIFFSLGILKVLNDHLLRKQKEIWF